MGNVESKRRVCAWMSLFGTIIQQKWTVMDGLEVLQRIQKDDRLIIRLTALIDESYKVRRIISLTNRRIRPFLVF